MLQNPATHVFYDMQPKLNLATAWKLNLFIHMHLGITILNTYMIQINTVVYDRTGPLAAGLDRISRVHTLH